MKPQENPSLADDPVRQRLAAVFDTQTGRRGLPAPQTSEQTGPASPEITYRSPAEWRNSESYESADSRSRESPDRNIGGERIRRVWDFTRSHLVALGMILLTGCLWAGYSLTQASSSQVPLVVSSATPSATEQANSPSATPTPPALIEIHILGSVSSPGVVTVPLGSRVKDVIAAAGGLLAEADPAELNLAEVVVDGSQILIGSKSSPKGEIRLSTSTAGSSQPGGKVSLNTATAAQLETIPGIGPVMAQRILAWRELHTRFTSVEELQEIEGIGPKTFANLADYVQL